METEYLGNAYTTQSSNDGCVAVACPIDAGCAINACGTAACGANACPADIFRIPAPCQRLRIISVSIRVPITYDCSLHFSLFLSLRLHTQ